MRKTWLVRVVCVLCAAPFFAVQAQTPAPAEQARPELRSSLPDARLIGQGRLKVWGFEVYDARLWGRPGFRISDWAAQPLALELVYLRDLKASDIAASSIKEMRRIQAIDDQQAEKWTSDLLRVIPDIKKGDRVTGIHQPGSGAVFQVNGKPGGEIADARFARLFFGIWLAPTTSEPKLRSALLTGADA
jgi:Chalcone isomerase-like